MTDTILDPHAAEVDEIGEATTVEAIDRRWPPTPSTLLALAMLGIGDRRAAQMFGVHAATFRAWRRRHRTGAPGRIAAEPSSDAAAYGFEPGADWPAGMRFHDDPRAARAGRGRIRPPMTVVETGSSLALLVP